MSDDIIDRLRCAYSKGDEPPCEACTFCVARAEIERLREQVAEMLPWFEDIVVGCALALDENERLRAVIDAVDDLHDLTSVEDPRCASCGDWPCPTHLIVCDECKEARRG